MKIFYVPITNKESLKNYQNTVINRINFEKNSIIGKNDNCGVWGFKRGKSNTRTYETIEVGDIVFFRINDDEKYQCFDGFAKVSNKINSPSLSKYFWNNNLYEHIIYFNEFILFDKPFRLSKNGQKLPNLNSEIAWHNEYNMFREWKLVKNDKDIDLTENLIKYFLSFEHKIIYNLKIKTKNFEIKEEEMIKDTVGDTEKEIIIKARIGQSKLRDILLSERKKCELCGINKKELLIASHIKPWSQSEKEERLDLNNVFLLCSMHDTLFDKGYISFDEFGNIIISSELDEINRVYSNINPNMKIKINENIKKYLEYHRNYIFKK